MHKYKVKKSELITSSVLLLSLETIKGNEGINFYPGQYAAISFKRFGRPTPMRCFSIVSSPNSEIVQFGIRTQGDFTNSAKGLQPGDRVNLQGPYGEFVIDDEEDQNIVMHAAGIGITPFMSMLRYATETRLKIPIILLYSCQIQDDVPFYDEITELSRKNPYIKVTLFITGGSTDKLNSVNVFCGRVNEKILDQVTNKSYNSFTHFICGPTKFISAIQTILINNDVSPQHLITEAFGQRLVTEKSHKKSSHETRLVYGITSMLIVLGTFFITGLDLVRAVPKISKIENSQIVNNYSNNGQAVNTTNNSSLTPVSLPNTSNPTPTTKNTNQNNSAPVTQNSPVTPVSKVS